MPTAILTAAQAAWTYVSAAFAASAAGTATLAQTITVAAINAAGQVAITVGLNAIARSQVPDPESGKSSRRQPRPERSVFMGLPSRAGGAYMLRETVGSTLAIVLALSDGRLASISAIYLNDDLVTLDGSGWVQEGPDGRYGTGDLVQIKTRLGVATETHYSELTAKFGDVWPTTARGDGIGSMMLTAVHRSKESFSKHFPNGEPMPTVVAAGVCYDWRQDSTAGGSGAQRRDNETTWAASGNPVVWLVHHEWFRCGRSWDRCIAPVLADLTDEADYCDEEIAKIGGTEPRYQFGGNYFAATQPQARREAILAACDGWLSTNGQGHMVIKVGRYVPPVFTLTGDHIVGYEWAAFTPDEEHINKLAVSYTEPAKDHTETECDPWVDEDDISATGMERSQPLALTWVQSRSQARRLAKRKMARLLCGRHGQIVTGVFGLNAFGHRYIRIQNPELVSMADVVVEVMGIEFDPMTATVVLDVILADEGIDAWNPATEEGAGVSDAERPEPEALAAPTISSVTPFFEDNGSGSGVRLTIMGDGPDREDLTWFARWRVDGDASWAESQYTDSASGSPVMLETAFVPADSDLEVQIAYQTGGGTLSPWSTTFPVTTESEEIIWDGND